MVWSPNWKDMVFNMLYFQKDGTSLGYPKTGNVPSLVNHPGVSQLTWDIVENYSTEAVTRLTYHNLYMYVYTCEHVISLVNTCPLEVLAELIPGDLIQVLKSISEMFEVADPMQVYEKYRSYYVNYGGENVANIDKAVIGNFFDFTPQSDAEYAREQKKLNKNK
jgi:hypothetical protein